MIGRLTVPVSPSIMCIGIDSLCGCVGVIDQKTDKRSYSRTDKDRVLNDRINDLKNRRRLNVRVMIKSMYELHVTS